LRFYENGLDVLHLASLHNHYAVIDFLLSREVGFEVDSRNDEGISSLMLASYAGNTGIVRSLLAAGANALAASNRNYTAFHFAAWAGNSSIISLLLESTSTSLASDCLLSLQTHEGYCALHLAARLDRGSTTALIASKVSKSGLDAKDDCGSTALHHAAFEGGVQSLRILLGFGADPTLRDNKGRTCLELAKNTETRDAILLSFPSSPVYWKLPLSLPTSNLRVDTVDTETQTEHSRVESQRGTNISTIDLPSIQSNFPITISNDIYEAPLRRLKKSLRQLSNRRPQRILNKHVESFLKEQDSESASLADDERDNNVIGSVFPSDLRTTSEEAQEEECEEEGDDEIREETNASPLKKRPFDNIECCISEPLNSITPLRMISMASSSSSPSSPVSVVSPSFEVLAAQLPPSFIANRRSNRSSKTAPLVPSRLAKIAMRHNKSSMFRGEFQLNREATLESLSPKSPISPDSNFLQEMQTGMAT